MKPAPFTYHRPTTREDAVRLLAELAPLEGRVLAGGQSLVPIMAFRLARPAHLIDINAVAGLDGLAERDGMLRIGARVRHAAFHRPVVDGPLGEGASLLVISAVRVCSSFEPERLEYSVHPIRSRPAETL